MDWEATITYIINQVTCRLIGQGHGKELTIELKTYLSIKIVKFTSPFKT